MGLALGMPNLSDIYDSWFISVEVNYSQMLYMVAEKRVFYYDNAANVFAKNSLYIPTKKQLIW